MPNLPWTQVIEAGCTASLAVREGFWMRLSLATMLQSQPGSRVALTARRADSSDTPYAVSRRFYTATLNVSDAIDLRAYTSAG